MTIATILAQTYVGVSSPDSFAELDTMALRLVMAAALGASIGFERELRDRSAGLKTHMLVSLASATFALIAVRLFLGVQGNDGANADPIRLIEAVTAGVAFLAAGAIIRTRDRVRGLTTGAGMWMSGAVGVCCGLGFYGLALMSTAIVLVIMTAIRWLEDRYL